MSMFLVIIIGIGWAFSQVYGDPSILVIAVVFSFFMNFFSFWFSHKIVLRMAGAKEADEHQYRDLHRTLENLAITAGLKKPKLYVIEDPVPNAFATGRNEENAVVAVTTGLLAIMDDNELAGVLSHELSHIGNRDILIQTIVVVLVGFIAILSDFFMRVSIFGGRDSDSKAGGAMIIIGIVLSILAPISATMIQLAISRKREFLADASGALLTRYPEGLASALEKIEAHSGKMQKVSHANAHLYIGDPFGTKTKGFFHKIFATHPPVTERVAALRKGSGMHS